MSKVAVLIATYGRTEDLGQVLRALSQQSNPPACVVVVDSSLAPDALHNQELISKFSEDLKLDYLLGTKASLTSQKNQGIQHLKSLGIDFVQILDDDTVPGVASLQRAAEFLQGHPEFVGISGVTGLKSGRLPWRSLVKKGVFTILGLESFRQGVVSFSGCPIPFHEASGIHESEWLFGCSMWRMDVFEQLEYDGRLVGSALFEDAIFSVRASQIGKLAVDTGLYLEHKLAPTNRPNLGLHSYRFARNRILVIRALGDKFRRRVLSLIVSNIVMSAWELLLGLVSFFKADREMARIRCGASLSLIKGTIDACADRPPR